MFTTGTAARVAALTMLMAPLMAAPASAQDGYLFREPKVNVTLRIGAARPAANDDLFTFFKNELARPGTDGDQALDASDFEATSFGADVGLRLQPQIDGFISFNVAHSSTRSEFQEWVHDNDSPIEQTTRFTRIPVTAGIRFYPVTRGRAVGNHAWVPTSRFAPYVGGGVGVMFYELEQSGEFVDAETLDIFRDFLHSQGAAFTAQALGGAEFWLTSRIGVNLEGRYSWAKADLDRAFADFDRIDLKGWQVTTGLSVRF